MERIKINLTKEQGQEFRKIMAERQKVAKEKMDKIFAELDPNVTAMLRLANTMSKSELLALHPEHSSIINKITFNT